MDNEKRRLMCRTAACIVVAELCCGQVRGTIALCMVDIGSEVLFQLDINAFCLAVSLWMVRRAKFSPDCKAMSEVLPYGGDELRAAVRDDFLGGATEFPDVVQ